jgi:hypothetical protein
MQNKTLKKLALKHSFQNNSMTEDRCENQEPKFEERFNLSSENPFKTLELRMDDRFNQLITILEKYYKPKVTEEYPYLYSLKELGAFLNCSVVTCQKMKNNGSIPYMQDGRKLIFEKAAVLEALKASPIYKKAKYKR